jgi:hypothetical protein
MDRNDPRPKVFVDICVTGPGQTQKNIWEKGLTDLQFVKTDNELVAGDILVTKRPLNFPSTHALVVDPEYMVERRCQKKGIPHKSLPSPSPEHSPERLPPPSPRKQPKSYKTKCTTQRMDEEFLRQRKRVTAIMDQLKNTEKLSEEIEQHLASQPDLDVTTRKLLESSVVHMLGHRFGATWVERRESEKAAAAAPTKQS